MFAWQKLTDARGRKWEPCTIYRACRASGYPREYIVRPHETGRFWSSGLIMGISFAVLMMIFGELLGPLLGVDINMRFLSLPWHLQFWGYAIAFGGSMAVINKFYGWRNAGVVVSAMSRAGLCAGCGYKLDELDPEEDGCTVCPECGAAWRMP